MPSTWLLITWALRPMASQNPMSLWVLLVPMVLPTLLMKRCQTWEIFAVCCIKGALLNIWGIGWCMEVWRLKHYKCMCMFGGWSVDLSACKFDCIFDAIEWWFALNGCICTYFYCIKVIWIGEDMIWIGWMQFYIFDGIKIICLERPNLKVLSAILHIWKYRGSFDVKNNWYELVEYNYAQLTVLRSFESRIFDLRVLKVIWMEEDMIWDDWVDTYPFKGIKVIWLLKIDLSSLFLIMQIWEY